LGNEALRSPSGRLARARQTLSNLIASFAFAAITVCEIEVKNIPDQTLCGGAPEVRAIPQRSVSGADPGGGAA
jgi:hypothetical protein